VAPDAAVAQARETIRASLAGAAGFLPESTAP